VGIVELDYVEDWTAAVPSVRTVNLAVSFGLARLHEITKAFRYGYRDEEHLKLRAFNLHNSNYALTGGAKFTFNNNPIFP
jgi:hypothetical protein